MKDMEKHNHQVNVKIQISTSGVYVAQVVEIPSIIVQCEKKEDIREEITEAINGYFDAFPEEHDKMNAHNKEILEPLVPLCAFEAMTITR
jgi:predicted RNase H-like HicB family nuclease